jgi:Tol biopolymer transport system component
MGHLRFPDSIPLLLAAAVLTACVDDSSPPTATEVSPLTAWMDAPPQFPGSAVPGSIAFTSTRDGAYEIYAMNPGRQHVTRLTISGPDVEWNQQPDWSPDGTKLLFTRRATIPGVGLVHDVHVLDLTEPNPQPRRFMNNPGISGGPAWSPDGRYVAYCSFNTGAAQVWVFDVATATAQPLGSGPACWPDWSPDGSEIAYHTTGPNPELVVMNLVTKTVRFPAPGPTQDVQPEWSPDGSQLVFRSNRDRDATGAPYWALFTVPADGSAPPTNITPIPDGVTAAQWNHDVPTWSQNSASVLVGALRPGTAGTFQLLEVNVASGHAKQLSSPPGHTFLPSVGRARRTLADYTTSPGRTDHGGGIPQGVTFVSARDGNREIYTMNADGSALTRLTFHPAEDVTPAWSPSGQRITFTSVRDENREIYVMASDGSGQMNLTNHSAFDQASVFSPDGKQLAFYSDRDGNFEIYVMNADGTEPTRLTFHPGVDQYPDWSPNGKQIVFQRDGDIYLLDVGTGAATLVWDDPVFADMPVFSPNARQITFMSRSPGYPAIFVIGVDGSQPVNLTPKPPELAASAWQNAFPEWSRNGREIYFITIRPGTNGAFDVFAMNADGTGVRAVTMHPAFDSAPETR